MILQRARTSLEMLEKPRSSVTSRKNLAKPKRAAAPRTTTRTASSSAEDILQESMTVGSAVRETRNRGASHTCGIGPGVTGGSGPNAYIGMVVKMLGAGKLPTSHDLAGGCGQPYWRPDCVNFTAQYRLLPQGPPVPFARVPK